MWKDIAIATCWAISSLEMRHARLLFVNVVEKRDARGLIEKIKAKDRLPQPIFEIVEEGRVIAVLSSLPWLLNKGFPCFSRCWTLRVQIRLEESCARTTRGDKSRNERQLVKSICNFMWGGLTNELKIFM